LSRSGHPVVVRERIVPVVAAPVDSDE